MERRIQNKQRLALSILLVFLLLTISVLGVFSLIIPTNAYAESRTSNNSISDLKFTLYTNVATGNPEYKVSASNRNLTSADIPTHYNEVPVTEVSDNAFTNCTQLTFVRIPITVRRLGNGAFSNCTQLTKIIGMTNVTVLGNNVFNNCTAIEDLILPANLEYVGSSIVKNVNHDIYSRRSAIEMTAMNANWDIGRSDSSRLIFGNKLVCDEVKENGVAVGYEIRECQNLAQEEDFIVYSSWKKNEEDNYLPIVNIKRQAFEYNTFGSLTIKHDESLSFNHTMNINSYAFSNVTADSINIEMDITLIDENENDPTYLEGEIGTSVSVFEWTNVNTITLPSSLNRIPRSMFAFSSVSNIKCTDETLAANHLPNDIIRIDTSAFDSTWYLKDIYLPTSIITMGDSIFNDWGSGGLYELQSIHIDMESAPSSWGVLWNSGINFDYANINFTEVVERYGVEFDKQGGIGGTDSVNAVYDEVMPTAEAPTRQYFTFNGYFSGVNGTGIKYYNADMTSARNWDIKSATTLYASWTGVIKRITFDKQGGTGGTVYVDAEYGKAMPTATAPTLSNYIFQGYFTGTNGTGIQYYNANMESVREWNKTTETTLYAHWIGVPCEVTLDKQGGINGSNYVVAIYNSPMPTYDVAAPTREHYYFKGYYSLPDGQGSRYYDENMNSVKDWDKTIATTVYAKWEGVKVTVIFNKDGGINGTDFVIAEYGKPMPTGSSIVAPKKEGFAFLGYYLGNIKYYYDNMLSAKNSDLSINTTLMARWDNNRYTVELDPQGGNIDNEYITVTYAKPMPPNVAMPTRTGYTFKGFFIQSNGKEDQYYSASMQSVRDWDIDQDNYILFADWVANEYTVTLDKGYGYGESLPTITVRYGSPMLPNIPKPNYFAGDFLGYYYDGVQYYNKDMKSTRSWDIAKNVSLKAKYNIYTITVAIHYVEGKASANSKKLDSDTSVTLLYDTRGNLFARDIKGYTFKSWDALVTDNNGNETITQSVLGNHYIPTGYEAYNMKGNNKSIEFYCVYSSNCIAEGSLITLADGSQKPVEQLTGNEQLLVWNLLTGSFDTAPILFIDHDDVATYEVINLYFSDGTSVKVISEHALWDIDLNKYVFLRNDAAQYIGHRFNKQIIDTNGNMSWMSVELTSVIVQDEVTSAWSPVTYSYLCYYVNGMLSMPGATEGLINIFEVDRETMQYDQEAYLADIAEYGLFTYEEFSEICPLPLEIFEAFNGQYLKVSISKGLITWEQLERLIQSYTGFFL